MKKSELTKSCQEAVNDLFHTLMFRLNWLDWDGYVREALADNNEELLSYCRFMELKSRLNKEFQYLADYFKDEDYNGLEDKLEEKGDLSVNTLVMCKLFDGKLQGWHPRYYVAKGVCKPAMDSTERSTGYQFIVPIKHFNPNSPDWKPAEEINWANFGKDVKV